MFNFFSSLFSRDEAAPKSKARQSAIRLPRPLALNLDSSLHGSIHSMDMDVDETGLPCAELKIVVVGGKGVGKTSIIRRYSQDLFSKQYSPTLGVDLSSVEIEQSIYKEISPTVLVNFYDVAYNEVNGNNLMRILENASGLITVFDCSVPAKENARSLAALDQWYAAVADYIADGLPMILLGNKCDVSPCTISAQSLDMYAQRCGYSSWKLTTAKHGTSVEEAIDAMVHSIMKAINQYEAEYRRSLTLSNRLHRACGDKENEIDALFPGHLHHRSESQDASPTVSDDSTTRMSQERSKSATSTSNSSETDGEPKDVLGEEGCQHQLQHISNSAVSVFKQPFNPASAEGHASSEEKHFNNRHARISKYGRKVSQIQELVEEFYRQLHSDLHQMQGLWPVGDRRQTDIERLLIQAREEYQTLIARLQSLPSMSELVDRDQAALALALADIKKIHITASENVTKWQKLMHHLDTEIALSSHLTIRRSLTTQFASASITTSHTIDKTSISLTSLTQSSNSVPTALSPPSSSSPYSSPPSFIDPVVPSPSVIIFTSSPSVRQPSRHSSFSSSSYSSFASPSSSSSSSAYGLNAPLSTSASQLSLRHFSSSYLSGEIGEDDKTTSSSKLSTLTTFEPRPRSKRRRRKGFGFRNSGGQKNATDSDGMQGGSNGCSSGEITPLSSLTASFNSSPVSSQAASDDEDDSISGGSDDAGFLGVAVSDDALRSSAERSTRKEKLPKSRIDELRSIEGSPRTPHPSPDAPRRVESESFASERAPAVPQRYTQILSLFGGSPPKSETAEY